MARSREPRALRLHLALDTDPEWARQSAVAIRPEMNRKNVHRAKARLQPTRNGLEFDVRASDWTALRASANHALKALTALDQLGGM